MTITIILIAFAILLLLFGGLVYLSKSGLPERLRKNLEIIKDFEDLEDLADKTQTVKDLVDHIRKSLSPLHTENVLVRGYILEQVDKGRQEALAHLNGIPDPEWNAFLEKQLKEDGETWEEARERIKEGFKELMLEPEGSREYRENVILYRKWKEQLLGLTEFYTTEFAPVEKYTGGKTADEMIREMQQIIEQYENQLFYLITLSQGSLPKKEQYDLSNFKQPKNRK